MIDLIVDIMLDDNLLLDFSKYSHFFNQSYLANTYYVNHYIIYFLASALLKSQSCYTNIMIGIIVDIMPHANLSLECLKHSQFFN